MSKSFQQALQDDNLQEIALYPKSELHSHSGTGCGAKYISEWSGKKITPPSRKFQSLAEMQQWYADHIKSLADNLEGHFKRWEAAFQQAAADNIAVLALSFSTIKVNYVGGMEIFIDALTKYNHLHAPNTIFLPELTYDRACSVDEAMDEIDRILSYGFFKSIDICYNEFSQPIKNFKPLYRKAKEYGLRLKAHVGEFGTADDVMEAVEELELDEVHHGIAAASSKFVMNWLAEHKIQLNICPTSNVMLNVVDEYKNHPIKQLYHAGIPVTINTDDLLIFNQSVSEEYMNLYSAGVLNADELNDIRLIGLSQAEKWNS